MRVDKIKAIMDEERAEGLRDGYAEGYRVAERIFLWYFSNHQLKTPHSEENLEKWARKELDELKDKLRKAL